MSERKFDRTETLLYSKNQILYDLSIKGARIRVQDPVRSGESIKLRVLCKNGQSVEVEGEIKRIYNLKNNITLAGLQFFSLSPQQQSVLQSILDLYGKGVLVSAEIIG